MPSMPMVLFFFQKAVQRFLTAPVGGGGTGFAHDVALCPDAVGLHVVVVHAVVADEGIGLGDDLAIVAGVGQGLLKAHHAGGKDHLAHGDALAPTDWPAKTMPFAKRRYAFIVFLVSTKAFSLQGLLCFLLHLAAAQMHQRQLALLADGALLRGA